MALLAGVRIQFLAKVNTGRGCDYSHAAQLMMERKTRRHMIKILMQGFMVVVGTE